jgi:hypothetical protein
MRKWLVVRSALIVFAFLYCALVSQEMTPDNVTSELLFTIFCFGIIGLLFVVGIQRLNPRSAPIWRYPSWSINPFLAREPLQFFHLGGFYFLASGAGIILRKLFLNQDLDISLLFFPAFGAGTLCGIYVCTYVYKSKMEQVRKP